MNTPSTTSTSHGLLRRSLLLGILLLAAPAGSAVADQQGQAQLARTLQAHGGLEVWRAHGSLAYTMKDFPLSPEISKPNRSTVDLYTRKNRIEGEGFVVGFDGTNAWSTPKAKASGLPSRFVNLGSFYFVGIPFVLADPGVNVTWDGLQTFQGKEYKALKVTFGSGVGHSPDDSYAVFIDPATDRVALIHHNVTELYDQATRVTWVYNDYAQVKGPRGTLLLPSRLTFFQGWTPTPDVTKGASYTVVDYTLAAAQPDVALYRAPANASLNDQ